MLASPGHAERLRDGRCQDVVRHRRRELVDVPAEQGQLVAADAVRVERTPPTVVVPAVELDGDHLGRVREVDASEPTVGTTHLVLLHRRRQASVVECPQGPDLEL